MQPEINYLNNFLNGFRYKSRKKHIQHAYELVGKLGLERSNIIAELGCSGNETLFLLSKMGFEKILVADYDPEILDGVRKMFGHNVQTYHTDFNNPLPIDSKSVDLVTTFEVVEHIVNAEFYLTEIHRILKDTGRLVITTPNHAFYKSRIRALKGRRLGMEGYHYRFFTKEQFEKMLDEAGFKITERNSVGHLPLVDSKPIRLATKKVQVRHYIPENMESLCAINFVWLCEKKPL